VLSDGEFSDPIMAMRAQALIHKEGYRCDEVVALRVAGKVKPSGDIMVVASCFNGGEHVMKFVNATQTLEYYMDCRSSFNPVKCGK
jgi:hypothetical protein